MRHRWALWSVAHCLITRLRAGWPGCRCPPARWVVHSAGPQQGEGQRRRRGRTASHRAPDRITTDRRGEH